MRTHLRCQEYLFSSLDTINIAGMLDPYCTCRAACLVPIFLLCSNIPHLPKKLIKKYPNLLTFAQQCYIIV